MTEYDSRKLSHGLYRIFWKDGLTSLASVGSTYDGSRWYSPTNWTTSDKDRPYVSSTDWSEVDRVQLIDADMMTVPDVLSHVIQKLRLLHRPEFREFTQGELSHIESRLALMERRASLTPSQTLCDECDEIINKGDHTCVYCECDRTR